MKKLLAALSLCLASFSGSARTTGTPCPKPTLSQFSRNPVWIDRDCTIHTREDLEAILKLHKQWMKKYAVEISERASSKRLTLPDEAQKDRLRANLEGADLTQSDLTYADLSWADLAGASLNGTRFFSATLNGADLTGAHLEGDNLSGAALSMSSLKKAHLAGADLTKARLVEADLLQADLTAAILSQADLTRAVLSKAVLSGADLTGTQLRGTYFLDSDLSKANFTGAKFEQTLFEPAALPRMSTIARADGLRTLGWYKSDFSHEVSRDDPHRMENQYSVVDLVKALHAAGYRDAEAEANLAYHRQMQSWWQKMLFDWTCEWGANWQRPIEITFVLGAAFAVAYWSLLRFSWAGRPGSNKFETDSPRLLRRLRSRNQVQLLVVIQRKGQDREWPVGRDFAPPPWFYLPRPRLQCWYLFLPASLFRTFIARLWWEQSLFLTASLFSVMSVLNLGVQGLDLGRWLRLMQKREFDLRARGTLRLLAGFQSVASFLLLALTAYIVLVQPIGE